MAGGQPIGARSGEPAANRFEGAQSLNEAFEMAQRWWGNRLAQVSAPVSGVLWWLIDPSLATAFMAIWVAVGLDFVTKLMAIAVVHRGFIRAIRENAIRSDIALGRTAIKIFGYFSLMAVAGLARHLLLPSRILSSVIYGFLFMVEAISIAENLVAAGLVQLRPLLGRLKEEQGQISQGDEAQGSETHLHQL